MNFKKAIVRYFYNTEEDYENKFNELTKDINLNEIVSYATREKRDNEINGREHWFISKEEAKNKLSQNNILAYTKIGDIEYFTTNDQLNESNVYKINPDAINDMKLDKDIISKIIYISVPDDIRLERAKSRSDYDKEFEKRNSAEDKQFTEFEKNGKIDKSILNIDLEESIFVFIKFIIETYRKNPNRKILFIIVGRTASGKDTILIKAKEILNKK